MASSTGTFKIQLKIQESGWQKLSLGFKSTSAGHTVKLIDAKTGETLDSRTVPSGSSGNTLNWKVKGNVKVVVSNPTGGTVKLAGMKVVKM